MHQLLAWLADRTSLLQTTHRADLAAHRDPIWPDGYEPSSIRVDRDRAGSRWPWPGTASPTW
ncbi:MAG TPA: hypothetical protein VIV12_28155, partial [Streptosporangiaceae bacterium]